MKNKFSSLFCLLLAIPPVAADSFVRDDIILTPGMDNFSVCFDHSCQTVVNQSLSHAQWKDITRPFLEPPSSAPAERLAIAEAIRRMEAVIGPATGTARDKGGNIAGFGLPGQMDCIDESTNTTTYLRLLEKDKRLEYHRVADRATRFGLFVGMPHTTAVISEIGNGRKFAVDSWFFDNARPPAIVDIATWKAGWRPDDEQP